MASNTEIPARGVQGQWKWLVWFCQWCWSQRGFIWGAVILNFVLAVTATWLFTDPATLTKSPVGWVFQNITTIFIIFIVVLSLTIITGAVSQIPVMPSLGKVKRDYLHCMMRETEKLALTGIPAGLIAESVYIDEVFIPVELRPNRPRTDYPFTDVELARFRQNMQSGKSSMNEERALISAERNWHDVLKTGNRISIADSWRMLTIDSPAAVIQGYPGMGKSTLMERLTLHMARRGLKLPDPTMPGVEAFENALVPLLIRLGKYADACKAQPGLTLDDYLRSLLSSYAIANIDLCIQQTLQTGQGLVLFDGLDEVSDAELRSQVQESIKTFIRNHRTASGLNFNRFLITSRVAGYDLAAFPDYRHMTIAELTDEQIDYFLPRWCRANLSPQRTPSSALAVSSVSQTTTFSREVEQKAQQLAAALKSNAAVRELAENPLLLTLMVVMQQNSIVLPQQRVQLYDVVTRTLLENRNIAKNLTPIPENQAMQYLGPLAFAMQEEGNSLTRERDVLASLRKTIAARSDAGKPEEIEREAKEFLKRIRERGGLFVERTGDYFGFMHRTFQEYFAARYMLNQIKDNQQQGIDALVNRACHNDDLWREPFLLAVAYQSGENEKVADSIITALLDTIDLGTMDLSAVNQAPTAGEHDLLLAAECLIEAKPLSIDATLEKDIAHRLLQAYEQAQIRQRYSPWYEIKNAIHRWLLSLPKEAYRSPLLTELRTALGNTGTISRQRATLTLLIAQQLTDCPKIVFETLIPPLLALTGLPAIGPYKPDTAIASSPSLDVADLALTALSFLGNPGPSGILLTEIRQYFASNPEHLRLLARYSLECGTLLTLTVIPLQEENYRRYKAAIGEWITLRDALTSASITGQAIEKCRSIHQTLLDCTEEVCYPSAIDLQKMLHASVAYNTQSWQSVWQDYLTRQLDAGHYLNYQQSASLWVSLFPAEQDQKQLAIHLVHHYHSDGKPVQRFAERFFAAIVNDMRNMTDRADMRSMTYLRDMTGMRNMADMRGMRDMIYLRDLGHTRGMRDMIYLRDMILTQNNAGAAMARLSAQLKVEEQADLLVILLGRVLQVTESKQKGPDIKREVQQIVQDVYPTFTAANDVIVRECALDILRYLPARSASEIEFVLQLANGATDKRVQEACAQALEYSNPERKMAWVTLKGGKRSQVAVVRQAVERRLKRGW